MKGLGLTLLAVIVVGLLPTCCLCGSIGTPTGVGSSPTDTGVVLSPRATSLTPSEPSGNWKLYVTELLIGEQAIRFVEPFYQDANFEWRPESGWQFAAMRVVFENISGSWAVLPYAGGLWGSLIDSGGYERPFERLELAPYAYMELSEDIYLPPQLQIEGVVWAKLPQNQTPSIVRMFVDYNGDGTTDETLEVDLSQPLGQPPVLFDSVRSQLPISTPEYVFDFPNEMCITLHLFNLSSPTRIDL